MKPSNFNLFITNTDLLYLTYSISNNSVLETIRKYVTLVFQILNTIIIIVIAI